MKNKMLEKVYVIMLAAAVAAGFALPVVAAGGMIKIKGSDTVLPLAAAWAEAYMKKNHDVMISVTGGGSGVGLAGLINGSCDIANASRAARPKEITQGRDRNVTLKATTVAKDGVAVIVNPANPMTNISMANLAKLYTSANNWKDVGGENMKVVAIGRDSSSGTYVFFQDTVLKGKRFRQETLTLPSNNAICQSVARDKGAVGYVGLAFAKEFVAKKKVKIIAVDGTAASDESVKSGKYKLWRPLYCYTNGQPKGEVADYLKFVTGPEGQKMVEKLGYVAR
ncbi:MAG: PstS family phosphate ABC transporter substrate-binding protein [Armatimonadetes bacterium]|nr:PstS family phosphate ABC transporter substrate-binding protein [Armatimonadota bacterium]